MAAILSFALKMMKKKIPSFLDIFCSVMQSEGFFFLP